MTISVGEPLPKTTLLMMKGGEPQQVESDAYFGTGRTVVFGMPGAYTATCSAVHLPNVIAFADRMRDSGADRVAVLTTNDPFVLGHWQEETGADAAGVDMLSDPEGLFVGNMGLSFSFAPRGLINRAVRFAMVVEDGKVAALNIEESRATCDMSGGEAVMDILGA